MDVIVLADIMISGILNFDLAHAGEQTRVGFGTEHYEMSELESQLSVPHMTASWRRLIKVRV